LHLRLVTFGAGAGIFIWTLAAFLAVVPIGGIGAFFSGYLMTWGGLIHPTRPEAAPTVAPSPFFQVLFWFMLTSWMSAWLTFFACRSLTKHGRSEAEHVAYLGAMQAAFPFLVFLTPFIYYVWSRASRPETSQKGWSMEDWLPTGRGHPPRKKATH
jgi:hypothetical protein